MKDQNRKTVVVTGGSRGIGRAICERLAGPTRDIVLLYHTQKEQASAVVRSCQEKGATCLALQTDVSSYTQMEEAFAKITDQVGGVDILVNNAALSVYGLIQDIDPVEWDRVFSVNVSGAFYATKLALPHMLDQKWGRIINIASVWGQVGASYEALYAASKGALIAFSKSTAKEVAYSGITCNVLCPGMVSTDMMDQLDPDKKRALVEEVPLGRFLRPDEIALWVAQLASEEACAMTGQVLSPSGGWIIQ